MEMDRITQLEFQSIPEQRCNPLIKIARRTILEIERNPAHFQRQEKNHRPLKGNI